MKLQQDDVAVITGGASGIGLALAELLLDRGLRVVVADIEKAALNDSEQALRRYHGERVLAVVTDVSKEADVQNLSDATKSHFGPVQLLCNNAGVSGVEGPVWQLDITDWQWMLGVNLWGVVHGVRAFVPDMVHQGRGHILNVASLAGLTAPPLTAPYNASKHAVVALSETLAGDLAITGSSVGVSVGCPAKVATGILDAARNRPPELQPAAGPMHEAVDEIMDRDADETAVTQSADETARLLIEGVEQDHFYITTHPELNHYIMSRVDGIKRALGRR
jgi:NAD(P)-dependent dehydrogenase (short-subunit alcohol dehydrogenase family)